VVWGGTYSRESVFEAFHQQPVPSRPRPSYFGGNRGLLDRRHLVSSIEQYSHMRWYHYCRDCTIEQDFNDSPDVLRDPGGSWCRRVLRIRQRQQPLRPRGPSRFNCRLVHQWHNHCDLSGRLQGHLQSCAGPRALHNRDSLGAAENETHVDLR